MKVKIVPTPSKIKPLKKSLTSSIKKKKISKPTSGVLKNIVKITDEFEVLKNGNNLTGISCSKDSKLAKPAKQTNAKALKQKNKSNSKVSKNSVDIKKSKKRDVPLKPKKLKKETVDGGSKVTLKSKILNYSSTTEVNDEQSAGEPKLDITKVILYS